MNWKEIYEEKLCSPEEAVNAIKSGDKVFFAHCVAEPPALVEAMVANAAAYEHVEIRHMVSLGKGDYTQEQYKDNFTMNSLFAGASTRRCIAEGYGEFTPVFFHEVPGFIRRRIWDIDVLLVMVSPPDEHGYCSTGVSSDYTMQAAKSAKIVLAQVNDQMPVVYGDTFIHVSELSSIVEVSQPLAELKPPTIGPVEEAIGKHCASLIEDGSTLQLGIGAIPDAVLGQLGHKQHLHIHSEMISDGVVDLYESGAIEGKMTVTFLMGTKRLYDFVHQNPAVEMRPVDYVNHPVVVAQQPKLVSINSCLQVDFMGQVVSDSIGTKQFSGVGGQVDFVRGAAMSLDEKGKAIIAMPSVTVKKDGTMISKIVPFIDHGAAVTTSRNDVDYVITEYGIARLKGKCLKDRARQLIEIAHPDVQDELKRQFEERFRAAF